jgi:hypothetical protein
LTLNSPDSEVLQLSVLSEAPTDLNADEAKKFREAEWLISTILLEINQLEGGRVERNPAANYSTRYRQLTRA